MIEVTLGQRTFMAQAEETPPRVVDPVTHAQDRLGAEEVYDRVRRLFDS